MLRDSRFWSLQFYRPIIYTVIPFFFCFYLFYRGCVHFFPCFSLLRFFFTLTVKIKVPYSLRKQPTFYDATTGSPAKWRLRNERRNPILMTRHYPDLGGASDWLKQISHAARPIRSTTQIWVIRHQYEISALISQTSFRRGISGSVVKCRLFSQASTYIVYRILRIFWKTFWRKERSGELLGSFVSHSTGN